MKVLILAQNLIDVWLDGFDALTGDRISFYTFFTVILAECAYLWGFHEASVAIPITVILFGYMLNVIVFSQLKWKLRGPKSEKVVSILYVSFFVTLFVIGCFFNLAISVITTAILFGITALWIVLKYYQYYLSKPPKISLYNFFYSFWILVQIIIIGSSFVVFVIFFAKIPFIPTELKVIIPLVYLIFSPLIAFFEDEVASYNIFGLAYSFTLSREFEEYRKKIKKKKEEINSKKK